MTGPPAPDHPVLVVGAGPVGMTAALALRAAGLPATVLEAGPADRERPGSRAVFVHRESLLHLERVREGLGWEIARHGLTWQTKRTFWGGREVFAKTYRPVPPGTLPPSVSLPQAHTEELLLEACKAAGVCLAWDAEVTAVESTRDGGVRLLSADGREWTAAYVIAADGARSAVRAAVDLPLEGSRSANSFVIVDVDADPDDPLPPERVFHYHHPAVGGRNVLMVPFAGGWRVDLTCRTTDDPARFQTPAGVRRWLTQVLPEPYGDRIRWVSTYRFLQVLARDFADPAGRVMLVGEAAHLFAPFGARGMNSGIPDALAAVDAAVTALRAGTAADAQVAVEEFARTRYDAAVYNRAAAAAALRHMLSPDPRLRLRRRAAATLALAGRRAGAWLDSAPYGPKAAQRNRPGSTY